VTQCVRSSHPPLAAGMNRPNLDMATISKLLRGPEHASLASAGLLILRLGIGLSMAFAHGLPKLQKLLGDDAVKFSDPFSLGARTSLALATFGELVCALLIAVGFLTRLAVVPFAFTMLVAILYAHGDDPWSKKEHAFLFLVPAIALFCTGPGKYSVDGRG
jgi:putative oxidoreductase